MGGDTIAEAYKVNCDLVYLAKRRELSPIKLLFEGDLRFGGDGDFNYRCLPPAMASALVQLDIYRSSDAADVQFEAIGALPSVPAIPASNR